MFGNKKPYKDRTDSKRFHCASSENSPKLNWKTAAKIDVAYRGIEGGLATFGSIYDKDGTCIAGIKVFNRYKDPTNNPRLCQEEYDILCKLPEDLAPTAYMVGTYDWADMDDRGAGREYPAIVMEALPYKESLLYELEHHSFTNGSPIHLGASRVMEIAQSICQTVISCHRLDVIHRDLSLNNVFIQLDNHAVKQTRLIDFGSGTFTTSDLNATMGKKGTPHYASPEMCLLKTDTRICPNGKSLYDLRKEGTVDVWSIGAIMYRLYTGEDPHAGLLGDDPVANVNIKKTHPLDIGADLDPTKPLNKREFELRQLILHCTRFYPEHRPSIDKVLDALNRALTGAITPPPSTSLPGNIETAVSEFSREMNMDPADVYAMLDEDNRDAAEEYASILGDYKWNQIAEAIADEFDLDQKAVSGILVHGTDIESGHFADVFEDTRRRFAQIVDETKAQTVIPTFTVTYKDGVGGAAFADKVFTVFKGSPTPAPNVDDEIASWKDEAIGWDKPLASVVMTDAEYTMTWKTKMCKVVFHDGVGGEKFADKVYEVPLYSQTPIPDLTDEEADLSEFGYEIVRWAKEDDRDQGVAMTVTDDVEYTLLWRKTN